MARKRPSSRRRPRRRSRVGTPAERPWAALFYLCGDHDALSANARRKLAEITRAGSAANLYVAVQCDLPDGAVRFVAPEGGASRPDETVALGAVNTGDPAQVIEFLRWAVRRCPARHVALCFGGTGIASPESVIGKPQGDARRLFSICDDASARDALEVRELPGILAALQPDLRGSRFDLVAFDMSEMQFLEIAFELHGLADVTLGYQTSAPEEGWPYGAILKRWNDILAQDADAGAQRLATSAVGVIGAADLARTKTGDARAAVTVSAIDLNQLDRVTYAFDTMFLALMQALGDKILDRARKQTLRDLRFRQTDYAFDLAQLLTTLAGHLKRSGGYTLARWYREQLKDFAERDRATHETVQQLVDSTPEPDLEAKLKRVLDRLPTAFHNEYRIFQSELVHAAHLARLIDRALEFVRPADAAADSSPFILACGPEGTPRCGVSIYRPRNLDRLMGSNYLDLQFHRRVHWTPLLAAVNLIDKHPRGLWRVVSSLVATTGGSAREDVLRRLAGPDSVVVGMREQFQALARPPGVTLSLSPEDELVETPRAAGTDDCPQERRHYYRLRLESFRRGATVVDQQSRINPRTIDGTLDLLERLLRQPWLQSRDLERLESLGRTLGEDIIQTVAASLYEEHSELPPDDPDAALHLTLQIPRELMRYPWELMHDGRGILCERYALGRQVFMEVGLARRVPRRPPGAVRVLVIGDPRFRQEFLDREREAGCDWRQLPGARNEAHQVANVFERLNQGVAAYVGPLWPINDAVAMQIATAFYGELLLERGEPRRGAAVRQARGQTQPSGRQRQSATGRHVDWPELGRSGPVWRSHDAAAGVARDALSWYRRPPTARTPSAA